MSVLGPQEFLLVTVAGNGEDVAVLLEGEARPDARAGVLGGFNDQHAERHAAEDAIADWEILWSGERAKGNSEISALREQGSAQTGANSLSDKSRRHPCQIPRRSCLLQRSHRDGWPCPHHAPCR